MKWHYIVLNLSSNGTVKTNELWTSEEAWGLMNRKLTCPAGQNEKPKDKPCNSKWLTFCYEKEVNKDSSFHFGNK